MSQVSLGQMKALVSAVETGSFSGAARVLGKSQAAISTAISNLEIDLNLTLFERSGHKPQLTPAGELIVRECRFILERCDNLSELASSLNVETESNLLILASQLFHYPSSQRFAKQIGDHFPQLMIAIEECDTEAVIQRISDKQAELGFVITNKALPSSLGQMHIATSQFIYVCAPGLPIADLPNVTKADLAQSRELVVSRVEQQELEPNLSTKFWQLESASSLVNFLLNGCGWAKVPRELVMEYVTDYRLVELKVSKELKEPVELSMIWHPSFENGAVHRFIQQGISQIVS
ncbi:LysR family transcriptional regulator [Paraferrimonas sedimenticola]|uniref:LysR family transcriptional regulator n=1 Tax=Paraferrimonas sedimenticola TaxID=375674 RepID=A0AA37RWK5_9GAMM|nr:LysR family transcriptional regulator [Paraferrimonas sedimenticola]GLP96062.1 LysR family transcriptional regulator [Paraferrimonas sedimenticola]